MPVMCLTGARVSWPGGGVGWRGWMGGWTAGWLAVGMRRLGRRLCMCPAARPCLLAFPSPPSPLSYYPLGMQHDSRLPRTPQPRHDTRPRSFPRPSAGSASHPHPHAPPDPTAAAGGRAASLTLPPASGFASPSGPGPGASSSSSSTHHHTTTSTSTLAPEYSYSGYGGYGGLDAPGGGGGEGPLLDPRRNDDLPPRPGTSRGRPGSAALSDMDPITERYAGPPPGVQDLGNGAQVRALVGLGGWVPCMLNHSRRRKLQKVGGWRRGWVGGWVGGWGRGRPGDSHGREGWKQRMGEERVGERGGHLASARELGGGGQVGGTQRTRAELERAGLGGEAVQACLRFQAAPARPPGTCSRCPHVCGDPWHAPSATPPSWTPGPCCTNVPGNKFAAS